MAGTGRPGRCESYIAGQGTGLDMQICKLEQQVYSAAWEHFIDDFPYKFTECWQNSGCPSKLDRP